MPIIFVGSNGASYGNHKVSKGKVLSLIKSMLALSVAIADRGRLFRRLPLKMGWMWASSSDYKFTTLILHIGCPCYHLNLTE